MCIYRLLRSNKRVLDADRHSRSLFVLNNSPHPSSPTVARREWFQAGISERIENNLVSINKYFPSTPVITAADCSQSSVRSETRFPIFGEVPIYVYPAVTHFLTYPRVTPPSPSQNPPKRLSLVRPIKLNLMLGYSVRCSHCRTGSEWSSNQDGKWQAGSKFY